mgnify:CR=1 FL=1
MPLVAIFGAPCIGARIGSNAPSALSAELNSPEGDGVMGHVGKLIEKAFEWTDELQSIQIGEYVFEGQRQVNHIY